MSERNGSKPTHTSPAYPPKSAADKAAFAAVSYTRIPASATEPLSERGQAALDRLVDVLSPAPLPTETASRRRVMNVRGW